MILWKNPTAAIAARYHGGKYTYHPVEKHLSEVVFLDLLVTCAISYVTSPLSMGASAETHNCSLWHTPVKARWFCT